MNIFKLLNWKYRHFQNKLKGIDKTILDLQFKRFKTLEVREEIRQAYNNHAARLDALTNNIKKQKETPTLEAGEIARLDDQKVLLERDIDRYKKQIDLLDAEVNGAAPTNEYPEGIQGINQQLDALQELKLMVKSYLKNV